jgi:hypothetical protein
MEHMPEGMELKSEGLTSNIYDPSGFDLETHCKERGLHYEETGYPIPLATFIDYGVRCHEGLADLADPREVSSVEKAGDRFFVRLSDDEEVEASSVVVASGVTSCEYVPSEFEGCLRDCVTHSSAHKSLGRFEGKRLMVVGAGSSATDVAVLAAEKGAKVTVVSRSPLIWGDPRVEPRPLTERLAKPQACPGPGLRAYVLESAPLGFRLLPANSRYRIANEVAGPSGGWFVRKRFEDSVELLERRRLGTVSELASGVSVELISDSGKEVREVDHLVLATGYRTDIRRLSFLSQTLRDQVRAFKGAPILSTSFESSTPGLYFVGKAAAPTFGPMMRFVCGTEYTSKRLGARLVAVRSGQL